MTKEGRGSFAGLGGHWAETSLEAGEYVGGVVLTKHLGAGGGADVWAGRDEAGNKATVCALTVDAGDEAIDRYLARASELAESDPIEGLAPVNGVDPVARACFVDFAAAATLATADMSDYDEAKTVALFRGLVEIVARLHAAGIVHGWLRPENILLDARHEMAVANARGLDLADTCRNLATAIPVHKPYTAPEVRQGSIVDPTSDVYALGRIFHFMLVGAEPNENDERLPRIDPLRHITPDLHRIARKCVLQDKSERYPDAGHLLADIDRIGSGELVGEPHPDFDPEDLVKLAKSRKPVTERPSSRPQPKFKKPPPSVIRPQRDDGPKFFWTTGKAIVSGILGVLLLSAAFGLTYALGQDSATAQILLWLSALPLGLMIPGTGRSKILARGLLGSLILGVFAFVNPVTWVEGVRKSGLEAADVQERVDALKALRADGEVDFTKADLSGADLSGMDLTLVILDGGSLAGCNCTNTILADASTWNLDVTKADFSGANLAGTIPQLMKGWETATCDPSTLMPAGWECRDGRPAALTKPRKPKE